MGIMCDVSLEKNNPTRSLVGEEINVDLVWDLVRNQL